VLAIAIVIFIIIVVGDVGMFAMECVLPSLMLSGNPPKGDHMTD